MNKLLYKISNFIFRLLDINFISHHKIQNKNQVTNLSFISRNLKQKKINPTYIVDVGCAKGDWTRIMLDAFPKSKYYLFDADDININHILKLKKHNKNIFFKLALLSNEKREYKFYKMGYGSSIYHENTSHERTEVQLTSTILKEELYNKIENGTDNILKIDVQGAEIDVLDGLGNYINYFELVILETSVQQYNKNAPLFDEVIDYMKNKNFRLYDIFDLKRLGEKKSFLIQCDVIFIKKNSKLFNNSF